MPTKVGFFVLEVAWRRISTLGQLKRRGLLIKKKKLKRRGWTSPNICNLCKVEEKSTNHILHYAETRIL